MPSFRQKGNRQRSDYGSAPSGHLPRRDFIRSAASATALGLVSAKSGGLRSSQGTDSRIVVVGAGLAGLTASYRLHQLNGWRPIVYEAQERLGGRVRTIRTLRGGQLVEGGAQTINSNETTIKRLLKELGLRLIDLWDEWPTGPVIYRFGRKVHGWRDLAGPLEVAENRAWRQLKDMNWPARYDRHGERAEKWDQMTVAEWIDEHCPGGIDGVAGSYLKQSFEVEYAGPAHEASALHMIYELGGSWGGGYDERWTIKGGNDRLVHALARRLPKGSIKKRNVLVALKANAGDTYTCTFRRDGSLFDVVADRVVLALPFSTLRDVDLSNAGFSSLKLKAIRELGMGVNMKMNMQFDGKPWQPATGESYSGLLTGTTWPAHVGLGGDQGIIVAMNGGAAAKRHGNEPAHGRASHRVVRDYLDDMNELFPGTVGRHIDGQSYFDNWPADPWVKGSYSYYKSGAFTSFAGIEGKRQGGVHFAGEHTAPYKIRGTMNGAVFTGKRAADEILAAYGSGQVRRSSNTSET